MSRRVDIDRFYSLLRKLEAKVGGKMKLSSCNGRMDWPDRGVYFFFGSVNTEKGMLDRVVRVGTHALKIRSRTTLWKRLAQHRGTNKSGGGNHRGSIFRLLVGEALIRKGEFAPVRSWGLKQDLGKAALELGMDTESVKSEEYPLELAVSRYIGELPFLWLGIEDEAGPDSLRGYIERNSIALLSIYDQPEEQGEAEKWLGSYSSRSRVRQSRLWNNNHVEEQYESEFLDVLERMVSAH